MNKIFRIALVPVVLAVVGCVPLSTQTRVAASNPASPNAPEAAYPTAFPILMAGTNFALAPQAEEKAATEHQHNQNKSTRPAEHKHHQDNAPDQ